MDQLRRRMADLLELPGQARNLPMEGLRGVAVSLVFLVHYQSLMGSWVAPATFGAKLAAALGEVGHCGVDLFFVLSGYLIYGAVLKARSFSYGQFMRRRVVRIYPTFAVMLITYLLLSQLVPMESKLPTERGAQLLYVLENALLLPGMFDIRPIMTVAWSLSYEVFFYAVIPLLVVGLGMKAWTRARRLAFFGAAAGAFAVARFLGAAHIQLVMFVSGIFVFEAEAHRREAKAPASPRAGASTVVLALAILPVAYFLQEAPHFLHPSADRWGGFGARTLWLSGSLAVFTLGAFQGAGSLAKALSFTPLRWLGNMSYSYYLVHGLALKAVALVVHRIAPLSGVHSWLFWAAMPEVFVGTVLASAVVFATVEKRFSLVTAPRTLPAGVAKAA